jgi:tetratricopeptide (TPR) repeat protein
MTIDRGFYKYGRLQKTRSHRRPVGSTTNQYPHDAHITDLLRSTPKPEDRERLYPLLAKASRALCLQIEPRDYDSNSNSTALTLNNLGLRQLDSGDIQGAFRSLMDAIDHDPSLALANNNLGLLYLEIGDPERAIDWLRKATKEQEDLDIAYGNLGLAYLELAYLQPYPGNRHHHCYENLRRARDIDPGEPMHHNNMGILFLELGDPQDALDCFQQAVATAQERDQVIPMYYENRGIAREAMGDRESAGKDFLLALSLGEAQLEASLGTP